MTERETMQGLDNLTPVEQQIAALLKSQPESWTNACRDTDTIFALIDQSVPEIEATEAMAHIALCSRCRREYAEKLELWQLSAEVRVLEARAAEEVREHEEQSARMRDAEEASSRLVSPPPVTEVLALTPSVAPASPPLRSPAVIKRPLAMLWKQFWAPTATGFALGAATIALYFMVQRPTGTTTENSSELASAFKTQEAQIAQLQREKQAVEQQLAEQRRQKPPQTASVPKELHNQSRLGGDGTKLSTPLTGTSAVHDHVAALQASVAAAQKRIQELERAKSEVHHDMQIARNDSNDARQVSQLLAERPLVDTHAMVRMVSRGGATSNVGKLQITLVKPVQVLVSGEQPILECASLNGAQEYKLQIDAPNGNEVETKPLSPTKWQVTSPLAANPTENQVYNWNVVARKNDEPVMSETGRFVVLSQALEHERQKYIHMPLSLGVFYAQAGLIDEAEQEFHAILKASPNYPLAETLLKELQAKRRHSQENPPQSP